MPETYNRYLLINNETLEPACWCHQDDMEDPIVGDSLEDLLNQAADWADLASVDFVESDEFKSHTIIKEVIAREVLDKVDEAELAAFIKLAAAARIARNQDKRAD